ncbi:MAG: hypothetical protein HZA08_03980 [Nitrospirae bacterium]|nr:hypothetical protein [Nitrospirota bacterium]
MRKAILIIILTVLSITLAKNSRADWQIDLDVYTHDEQSDSGNATNNLSLGSSTLSTELYDNKFDTIALTSEPVNAYFYHPEYKSNVQKLWRDYRGAVLPQEWEFEVQANNINKTINLKWQIQDNDNLHFILVDKDNGNEIDMASSSEYSYLPESTLPKKFLLKVAKNENPTSVDNSNITNNNINNSGTSDSGVTGSKGGGCGYIKDINGNNNNRNNSGTNAINMMILLVPMLLPLKQYVRRYAFNVINR